jgi:hypothetical protein
MPDMKYPCPCCGFLVFDGPSGTTFDICPICFWQDDESSVRYATIADGPNKVSLIDGQRNFAAFGACESRLRKFVRAPTAADQRDPEWRPVDPKIDISDNSHDASHTPLPAYTTKLYYWRAD